MSETICDCPDKEDLPREKWGGCGERDKSFQSLYCLKCWGWKSEWNDYRYQLHHAIRSKRPDRPHPNMGNTSP